MIIGIDPGQAGGIAYLDDNLLRTYPMPIFKEMVRGKKVTYISAIKIKAILKSHEDFDPKICIEDVHSIFGTSASSNFKMGYNLGMLHSLLDQLFSEYYIVPPKDWQKVVWIESDIVLKSNKRKDTKATSLNAAKRLFPNHNFVAERCRKPHDGMVDAALIAYYGSKQ